VTWPSLHECHPIYMGITVSSMTGTGGRALAGSMMPAADMSSEGTATHKSESNTGVGPRLGGVDDAGCKHVLEGARRRIVAYLRVGCLHHLRVTTHMNLQSHRMSLGSVEQQGTVAQAAVDRRQAEWQAGSLLHPQASQAGLGSCRTPRALFLTYAPEIAGLPAGRDEGHVVADE
jgi:hypothetical protein